MKLRSFLICPCARAGRGSGHLTRCLALTRALIERGADARILPCPSGGGGLHSRAELSRALGLCEGEWADEDADPSAFDMVLADPFILDAPGWERLSSARFLVGLDVGGAYRERFDYLIDVFPRREGPEPNRGQALCFLDLPQLKRHAGRGIKRILVSFGQEDEAGLGPRLLHCILDAGIAEPRDICYLSGSLGRAGSTWPPGLDARASIPDLRDKLHEFDLVLTHFGLTAYEAAAAGCLVVLANPSRLHEDLGRLAAFPSLGVMPRDKKPFAGLLGDPRSLEEAMGPLRAALSAGRGEGTRSLAAFLLSMELPSSWGGTCAACGRGDLRKGRVPYRDRDRTYRFCPDCGSASMLRVSPNPMNYGRGYFEEEYRAQYGRSYLEDMPRLRAFARARLDRIESLAFPLRGRRVLDIGCAYGAFLMEAQERGAVCFGLDPSPEAVTSLREVEGIQASEGYFSAHAVRQAFGPQPFDLISLWYVAEHFENLSEALRDIASLLSPGGILALSTPNLDGVSGRSDIRAFMAASPPDHHCLLSPASLGRVLKQHGYALLGTRVTGHHPERFPFPAYKGSMATSLLTLLSRAARLGDTFEAYARRGERN